MSERTYPTHAIAAVGAVVLRGDKILLVRRGYPPARGLWSIPGGVIEAGEKIFEAARRELLEETSVDAEPVGVICVFNNVVRDSSGRVLYHYLILDVLFDEKSIRGEPRAGGDASEAAWFDLERVLEREDITRTTRALVKRIISMRKDLFKRRIVPEETESIERSR